MSLAIAVSAGNAIETLENFSVTGDTTAIPGEVQNGQAPNYHSDYTFWKSYQEKPEAYLNKRLSFYNVTLTDWVARVPGLYWAPNSTHYRDAGVKDAEFTSEAWKVYKPDGKSKIVMGGIGDFILPPSESGTVIKTISYLNNASQGIPVLLYPEVIEYHKLKQGDKLIIRNAVWRQMSLEWSSRFPSFKELKRGYLVIDNPTQVTVVEKGLPVGFHPCTIMEYQSGDAILYDYVFCTADTKFDNYRKRLEDFFETYKNDKERYGRYLLAADAGDPLFEADYTSPLDLQRAEPGGRTQLSLITERIQNSFYHRGETITTLLEKIPTHYIHPKDVTALAVNTGLSPALLIQAEPAVMSAQLVDICIERKMLESLVDTLLKEHPEIINQ